MVLNDPDTEKVNSIFVDAMVSDNNDDLQKEVTALSAKIELLTDKISELNNNHNKLNK